MNKEEIIDWLKIYNINYYTINEDLTVDVDGDVDLAYKNLECLLVQFGKVTGTFLCDGNKLSSLKGCPEYFGKHFSCTLNKNLINLEYSPKIVKQDFACTNNRLLSLYGSPEEVGGSFWCQNNLKLSSLEYITPNIGGNIDCGETSITNVDNLFNTKGGNIHFSGSFIHCGTPIESLKDLYTYLEDTDLKIVTLSYHDLKSYLMHSNLTQKIPNKSDQPNKNKI